MIGLAEKARPSGTVLQPLGHLHLILLSVFVPFLLAGHWLLLLLLLLLLRAMLDIPSWMVNQRRRRYTDDAGQYKTALEQFLVGIMIVRG